MVGEPEGEGRVLLDEEHAHAVPLVDRADDPEDLLHHERGEPEGRLVEKEQARPQHQRAGEREHLLLPAGERARRPGAGARRGPGNSA